jgi:hypothetical protein
MRRTTNREIGRLAQFVALACALIGAAAPAPPTYLTVERTIQSIRESWWKAKIEQTSWNARFDALLGDLSAYSKAKTENERLEALHRISRISAEIDSVSWPAEHNLTAELKRWLRPRVRLAWARRRLSEASARSSASPAPSDQANRSGWVAFSQNLLGTALGEYEAAETITQRQGALDRVRSALSTIKEGNRRGSWEPLRELEAAIDELYNQRNLDINADLKTVSPMFDRNLVETGPVFRKGYWSQVTAGPKTGFGLIPSDDGIAFFNSQYLMSVTPVTDFHRRLAADPEGRRAANLYVFNATTYDWSEVSVTTVLRGTGLTVTPSTSHNIDVSIDSLPACGGELLRAIACLIGMDQDAINRRVKEGALPNFERQIPTEAQAQAQENSAKEIAKRNADLRTQGLVGDNMLAVRDFLISQLSLRSRTDSVQAGGMFQWRDAPGQFGADLAEPLKLAATNEPGITAHAHVGSILSNLAAGAYQRDDVRSVQNVMISIPEAAPGAAPGAGRTVTRNVDFPTYAKAVADGRKPGGPKVTVLRIKRPERPPEFSVDSRGYIAALIRDVQIDVPAPEGEARGGLVGAPAKIYRIKIPLAEVAISYQVESVAPKPIQIHAKVQDLNPGSNAEVLAIADDETKATSLSRFSTGIVMGGILARLRAIPIDVSLEQLKLPGFSIRSISPVDASGWLRVGLEQTGDGSALSIGSRPNSVPSRTSTGQRATALPGRTTQAAITAPEVRRR